MPYQFSRSERNRVGIVDERPDDGRPRKQSRRDLLARATDTEPLENTLRHASSWQRHANLLNDLRHCVQTKL